jgi:CBS domain-containing protein
LLRVHGCVTKPDVNRKDATMQLHEVMTQPVVVCQDHATLDHAARLMWEQDCGVIPVVDAHGRLCGVVTDRDICMSAYTQGQALSAIPVTVAMAKAVVAGHQDDSIESAEQLMQDNQVRRLPVVDGEGRPVGIVSLNDLARLVAEARRSTADRELVQTLAAISQPRMMAARTPPQPLARQVAR